MNASVNETKTTPTFTAVQASAAPRGDGQPRPPTHDTIARRAYDIYIKNGRKQGQCKQNWQQAEQSLRDQGQPPQRAFGASAPHTIGAR